MYQNRFDQELQNISHTMDLGWGVDSKIGLFAQFLQEYPQSNDLFDRWKAFLEDQAEDELREQDDDGFEEDWNEHGDGDM